MGYPDLERLLARLVRRVRLARAAEGLVWASVGVAGMLAAALICHKIRPFDTAFWGVFAPLLPVFAPLSLLGAWLRPVSRLAAAGLADRRLGLNDRLATAVEFLDAREPTPFMLAHLADADARARHIRPSAAIPLPRPRGLRPLAASLIVVAFLLVVPSFAGPAPQPAPAADDALPPMRFAGERSAELALERIDAKRDPQLKAIMDELKDLYASVRSGSRTKEQALARIGSIDPKLHRAIAERSGDAGARTWREAVSKALAEKGRELAKDPLTQALGRAMAEGNLDAATSESRSLAGDAKSTPPKLKLTPDQSKALAEIMKSAAKADGRRLDVLSRDLDKAANALTENDLKKLADGFESVAGDLQRTKDEMDQMKDLARSCEDLEEMKEALGSMERDASGRWSLKSAGSASGAGGFFQMTGPESPDKKGEPGVGHEKVGPGTGGKPERVEGTLTPAELAGRWGDGTSLVEVVKGAASEGLATLAYREAAEAAAREAESAVHGEDIPLGYRLYVKRYFQMIQPPSNASDR